MLPARHRHTPTRSTVPDDHERVEDGRKDWNEDRSSPSSDDEGMSDRGRTTNRSSNVMEEMAGSGGSVRLRGSWRSKMGRADRRYQWVRPQLSVVWS